MDVTLRTTRADASRSESVLRRASAALETCSRVLAGFPFARIDLVEAPGARGAQELALLRGEDLAAPGSVEAAVLRAAWTVLAPADGAAGGWVDGLAAYCASAFDPSRPGTDAAVRLRRGACLAVSTTATPPAGEAPVRPDVARALMLFDAMRRELGDSRFVPAIRGVIAMRRDGRFDWAAWQRVFEQAAGRRLDDEFRQTLERPGAPALEIAATRVGAGSGRLLVSGVLRQRLAKDEPPWRLAVPVVVEHLEGREESLVDLTGPETAFSIAVPSMPLRVEADPDWRLLRRVDAEDETTGLRRTVRYLLPDLRTATSPERAKSVLDRLAAAAGDDDAAEARTRRLVADELRLAGVEPEEREVRFSVKRIDPGRPVLVRVDGTPVEGVRPLVASPATPEGGVHVVGAVTDDDPDVAGRALVVDVGAGVTQPLAFLRQVASVAVARRAAAVFVRLPDDVPEAVAELTEFPETVPAGGGEGAALRRAATTAARTGSDTELPLPVVAVPRSFRPARDAMFRLDVTFSRHEVRTANLVGRVRAPARQRSGAVVLSARLDGAPAGVAAVLEAVNVLSVQSELLARDVTFVAFGGESWGGRGSRAFDDALADPAAVVAAIHAEDPGRGPRLRIVEEGRQDRLRRTVAAAARQSALDVSDDDARVEVPPRWAVPRRRAAAVSVTSATPSGAPADVDPALVARAGRALALAALAVAGGW